MNESPFYGKDKKLNELLEDALGKGACVTVVIIHTRWNVDSIMNKMRISTLKAYQDIHCKLRKHINQHYYNIIRDKEKEFSNSYLNLLNYYNLYAIEQLECNDNSFMAKTRFLENLDRFYDLLNIKKED